MAPKKKLKSSNIVQKKPAASLSGLSSNVCVPGGQNSKIPILRSGDAFALPKTSWETSWTPFQVSSDFYVACLARNSQTIADTQCIIDNEKLATAKGRLVEAQGRLSRAKKEVSRVEALLRTTMSEVEKISAEVDTLEKEMQLKKEVRRTPTPQMSLPAESLEGGQPLQYCQDEDWEDGQGIGGNAHLHLEFLTSKSAEIHKVEFDGKVVLDLGRLEWSSSMEALAIDGKWDVQEPRHHYSEYFEQIMGDGNASEGDVITRWRGPSRFEIIASETELGKILASIEEEAYGFARAKWDSVKPEYTRLQDVDFVKIEQQAAKCREIIMAANAWLGASSSAKGAASRSSAGNLVSAVHVRLEISDRTYNADDDSDCSDDDRHNEMPGQVLGKGVSVLLMKRAGGDMARLRLCKCWNDFAGCY